MVRATLSSVLFRNELFWVGIALYVVGVLVPPVPVATTTLGGVLIGFGLALLMVRLFAATFVILRTTYEGWRYGYAEGKLDN